MCRNSLERRRPFWAVALLVTMVLGGCSTDAQRTRSEGTAIGAGIGATVGGALTRRRDGALAGAVIGGVIGLFAGDRVVKKKAGYARSEDALRASAERATALAQATRLRNDQLEREIAALDSSVRTLRTATRKAREQQMLAGQQSDELRRLQATVDTQLAQVRGEVARQAALIRAVQEDARARATAAARARSEDLRRVQVSMTALQQEQRRLELARLQLQQIDRRRAY